MSLLTASDLSKSFGPDEIFDGISVEIPHRARIALVGPNGAGKTTLINLLAGLDTPTEGTVSVARGTRIGFLPQRPELRGTHSLWEEALGAFDAVRAMERELEELAARLGEDDSVAARYGQLQEAFEQGGGYRYESETRIVLLGLGFTQEQFSHSLAELSGGQRTRALLARLLLESPDLLILDEPTNHLDIEAVEWLERYLQAFNGAVLAVSHDRYFMDTFASTIWELEYGELEVYRGNYSHYLVQRQERHERIRKEYEAQRAFLEKEMEYIRRNMAGQNTRQAKGRLRRLETMQKRGRIMSKPRGQRREMSLRLKTALRSGDQVLVTRGLTVGYPDLPLFDVPDLTLYRGETVGLIGPNGAGKSTFLKTITGQLTPLGGEARLGASVHIGYFAQAHESLDPARTLLDEITRAKPMTPAEARNHLALFLFSGDDVFRKVSTLSGGERGRLSLAKLALEGANLLLLDEPTNHLDIDSQEVLQTVIANFDGTVILVTHDRYLVDALATQIWWAKRGAMEIYDGSYQEFVAERARRAELAQQQAAASASSAKENATKSAAPERKHNLNPYQLKRRLETLENDIDALERKLKAIEDALHAAGIAGESDKVRALGLEYTETERALDATMEEWESLAE